VILAFLRTKKHLRRGASGIKLWIDIETSGVSDEIANIYNNEPNQKHPEVFVYVTTFLRKLYSLGEEAS
jgi:hypothetical protein